MFRIARWVFLVAASGASVLAGGYLLARLQDPQFAPELMMSWVAACTLWVLFVGVYVVHSMSTKGVIPLVPSARREPHSQPRSVDVLTASAHAIPRPRLPESPAYQILPELPADNRPTIILPVTADCDEPTVPIRPGRLALAGAVEPELPPGVAKQIFELGRRIGRRDSA